jgi:hypothetical protein
LGTGLTVGSHLSASGAKRKGRRGGAGPAGGGLGQLGPMRAREKEKRKGMSAWVGCGPKVKGERERERVRVFLFFFKIFFSNPFFKHSNFNQTKSMHSNHDAQALIISKLF